MNEIQPSVSKFLPDDLKIKPKLSCFPLVTSSNSKVSYLMFIYCVCVCVFYAGVFLEPQVPMSNHLLHVLVHISPMLGMDSLGFKHQWCLLMPISNVLELRTFPWKKIVQV